MYVVRLRIKPSFKLNIHNQCSNVDLISPTYISHGWLECYRPPDPIVYAGNTMRSGFIGWVDKMSADGILTYRLQRNQTYKSVKIGKDTSSAAHLLVVWKISGPKKLYADVLLVGHDKGFIWNKNDLRELYRKSSNQFRMCTDSTTETWPLHDSTALMIKFEIMNEESALNIIISEVERDNYVKTSIHIDLNR
jgi:hypothetical protein